MPPSITEAMEEFSSIDYGTCLRSFTVRRYNQQLEEDLRNAEFFPRISGGGVFRWSVQLSLSAPFIIHPGVLLRGVKKSGRVVEAYTREHILEHGDEIITDLMFQIIRDTENDAFTPNPATGRYQLTPLGNLTLGPHVYRGARAIIFTVQERPDILIKYQGDCEEIRSRLPSFHPLLKETFYGNRAAQESMAVKSLFVSPPAFLCAEKTGICNFSMNDESYRKCKLSKGTIRDSVMDERESFHSRMR
jgi:hypothetical protein